MAWDEDSYAGLTQAPYDLDPETLGTISRRVFTAEYVSQGGTFTCPSFFAPFTVTCRSPHAPPVATITDFSSLISELGGLSPRPTWVSLHVHGSITAEAYQDGCHISGNGCGPLVSNSPVQTITVSGGFPSNADDPLAPAEYYPGVNTAGGMNSIMDVWLRPDSGGYPGHPTNEASALLWPYDELAATVLEWNPNQSALVHLLASNAGYGLDIVARPFIEVDWELESQLLLVV